MNREIKFRAKGVDGKWWYGETNPDRSNYRHINLATFFANLQVGQILVESLGDYMGLQGENGVEVYEGDIVHYHWDNGNGDEGWADDIVVCHDFTDIEPYKLFSQNWMCFGIEVIGNIYEELLK